MSIVRLSSGLNNTFYKFNSADLYVSTNRAVPIGYLFPAWPRVVSKTNAIGNDNPQYLWYRDGVDPAKTQTGEVAYFARETTIGFAGLIGNITGSIHASIVTDNAFLARISIIPLLGASQVFDINDGNTSINYYQSEVNPPFNWQNSYEFTGEIPLLLGLTGFNIEFEIAAVNYAIPGSTPQTNPAGFMYNIEITGLTSPTITEIVPPVLTNPLGSIPA